MASKIIVTKTQTRQQIDFQRRTVGDITNKHKERQDLLKIVFRHRVS